MTGRYPHNNGVRTQQDGPVFDSEHSMACYLRDAGYATYEAGKFLTTWPHERLPPCFDHSTVMWGGYKDVHVKVDGVAKAGRRATPPRTWGRAAASTSTQALGAGPPFLLYETPQAPHWVDVTAADGTAPRLAVPDAKYRTPRSGRAPESPRPTATTSRPTCARWTTRGRRRRRCARASCGPS